MLVSRILPRVKILITGVGMVNTAYYLGRHAGNNVDALVNVGICGAFNKKLSLGEVVNVVSDRLSEFGAEDNKKFIRFEDLKLGGKSSFVLKNGIKMNSLKKVNGITVNTVHGNKKNIRRVVALFNPDVESMEGAAFAMACDVLKKTGIQIRAVSNYVERRDKSKWKMSLAVKNLNAFLMTFVKERYL